MMKTIRIYFIITVSVFLFIGCKKTDTTSSTPTVPPVVDLCAGVTILPVTTVTHSITGQAVGTITVTSPIGSGFLYSINGTVFQGSVNFFNLAAGSYTVTAKNANGCTGTASVTINGYGPKFFNVRTIVNGYCGSCHLNGNAMGGKNYDADASVVAAWDRIKVRAVDGLPSFMPQGGQLTALDKQKIVDWINAGHRITD
jgi:uncharacterized membrane protein